MNEPTPNQVFICYAREDMATAKRLYQDLQRAGIMLWMDTENLQPGQQWKEMIGYELRRSAFVLVLLSAHSLTKRGYIRKELNDALDLVEQCPPDHSFLIPVRLEPCEPKEEQLRQFQLCDLFADYHKGLNQIFKVLLPDSRRVTLRREPLTVSPKDYRDVFRLDDHDLPREYIWNDFEDQGEVIIDYTTGLMWQKAGSEQVLTYQDAQQYIQQLNRKKFAGYSDWRLPTIPELISLLEPEIESNRLFINPIFDAKQSWCWSADLLPEAEGSAESAWNVSFDGGYVYWGNLGGYNDVRGVRSRR